jgi:hypothetical protein
MNWKKYSYTLSGKTTDTLLPRPLIEIIISNKTGKFPCLAMIDSGTDSTVLNSDIAKALYIEKNTCESVKLGGIGEKAGFRCEVDVYVPDFNVSVKIPVIFLEDVRFDGLLGQAHFFQRFNVKFEKSANTFYVAPAIE